MPRRRRRNVANRQTQLDGVNLLPYVTGQKFRAPHDASSGAWIAVRRSKENWKFVREGGSAPPRLFHLATDVCEKRDLFGDKPDVVQELSAAYAAWEAGMVRLCGAPEALERPEPLPPSRNRRKTPGPRRR